MSKRINKVLRDAYPKYKLALVNLFALFFMSGVLECIMLLGLNDYLQEEQGNLTAIFSLFGLELNLVLLAVLALISNFFKIAVQWCIQYYIFDLHSSISVGVVRAWLKQDAEQLIGADLSQLQKQAITDAQTFTVNMCRTILNTINGLIQSLFITTSILFTSDTSTLFVILCLVALVVSFAKLISRVVFREGQKRERALVRRVSAIDTIMDAIPLIKLGFWSNFLDTFSKDTAVYSNAVRNQQFWSAVPKPFFEGVIIFVFILITIFGVLGTDDDGFATFIPFGVAIYRMMPSITLIYKGVLEFKFYGDLISLFSKVFAVSSVDDNKIRPNESVNAIVLDGVSLPFGLVSKQRISTHFERGKVNFIVGESGAGKTTLANTIAGLLPTREGEIFFYDLFDNMIAPSRAFLAGQKPILNSGSLQDNLSFSGEVDYNDLNQDMQSLLKDFWSEETDTIGRAGSKLSSGQKQRLWIVKALTADASIVIFDEPTSNLDKDNRDAALKAIRNSSHDKLVIVITHDRAIISPDDNVLELGHAK